MPYFPDLKLLLIHIPKTGGTTIEKTLQTNTKITLYEPNFIRYETYKEKSLILDEDGKRISLQHQTYLCLKRYAKQLSIPFDDPKLRIISIVRNPYSKIVSDLFWFKFITHSTTPEQVFQIIKLFINSITIKNLDGIVKYLDNHNKPQYKFVTDKNDNLVKKIHIMKTETLTDDLKGLDICVLQQKYQIGYQSQTKYMSYLNKDSIKLINEYYKKDFELFNYPLVKKYDN